MHASSHYRWAEKKRKEKEEADRKMRSTFGCTERSKAKGCTVVYSFIQQENKGQSNSFLECLSEAKIAFVRQRLKMHTVKASWCGGFGGRRIFCLFSPGEFVAAYEAALNAATVAMFHSLFCVASRVGGGGRKLFRLAQREKSFCQNGPLIRRREGASALPDAPFHAKELLPLILVMDKTRKIFLATLAAFAMGSTPTSGETFQSRRHLLIPNGSKQGQEFRTSRQQRVAIRFIFERACVLW
jgi:hypothetical protein